MKLSTLVPLASGTAVASSSRASSDGSKSPDFGSLLGDLAPDVTAGAVPSAGIAPSAGAGLSIEAQATAGSSIASGLDAPTAIDAITTTAVQAQAHVKSPPPSASAGSEPRSMGAPVRDEAGAHGSLPIIDVLSLVTRAANQNAPSVPASVSSKGAPPETSGASDALGADVEASGKSSADSDLDASDQATGRVPRKRSVSSEDDAPLASVEALAANPSAVATLPPPIAAISASLGASASTDAGAIVPGRSIPELSPALPIADPSASTAEASIDDPMAMHAIGIGTHLGFRGAAPDRTVATAATAAMPTTASIDADTRRSAASAPAAPSAGNTDGLKAPISSAASTAGTATPDEAPAPASVSPTPPTEVPVSTPVAADAAAVVAIAAAGMPASPSVPQQVADVVATLAAASVPDHEPLVAQVAPARTMALQLSPAGLGTLTVHLHVVGRVLDVHLDASDSRTAALIDRDRDALSGALRGADYQLQSLSVTTHDTTMPGGTHADRGADTGSADARTSNPSGGGAAGDNADGRRPRDQADRDARSPPRTAKGSSLVRGDPGLFV